MENVEYFINEIYPCIQGEGRNVGKPSILIRFQLCNLKCAWCDTTYSLTATSDPIDCNDIRKGYKSKQIKLDNIIEEIKSYHSIKHIMFTGGEPTLQNFNQIFKRLGNNYTAEVESNATMIPHKIHKDFELEDYYLYQWNLSPKGNNSGQKINDESMEFWSELSINHKNIFFKFVVCKEKSTENLEEILNTVRKNNIQNDRVYLMPEGITLESQIDTQWLVDICLKYNFNYTPRLHVILYRNKRGV